MNLDALTEYIDEERKRWKLRGEGKAFIDFHSYRMLSTTDFQEEPAKTAVRKHMSRLWRVDAEQRDYETDDVEPEITCLPRGNEVFPFIYEARGPVVKYEK